MKNCIVNDGYYMVISSVLYGCRNPARVYLTSRGVKVFTLWFCKLFRVK